MSHLYDPPLSLYSAAYGAPVTFAGGAARPRLTIKIPANPASAEQAYTFSPLPAAGAPTA